ncbi:hypothetical protein F4677DRAFT_399791 [Hypoxylon crocopeplum]|nr:hypothetical protein F4677DRAFT_399791 [Hypoxylon crocopeplum]
MGSFALPVPDYRIGIHQRAGKRRKTGDKPGEELTSPEPELTLEQNVPSRLPSYSINPLSHSPDTLRQFAVAGLSPEDEVPSETHRFFPHKPLPLEDRRRRPRGNSRVSGGVSEAESEDDRGAARRREVTVRQYSGRIKHLSTLTAIMHRCLGEGDIARAKRAFGLLVQTKEVDIRQGGLWAIGSEILMRDPETEGQSEQQHQHQVIDNSEKEKPSDDSVGEPPRRWGSDNNVEKVKSYFEALIQQYPHDPHRPQLTSALDFWPALFGIEVYNLDAEFRLALHRLRASQQEEEEGEPALDELDPEEVDMAMAYPHEALRRRRDEERRGTMWAARDELRSETQGVAERIARRLDQTMENAPFATYHGLLRLRGNLALYIGDLYLPSRLIDDEEHAEGSASRSQNKKYEDLLRSRAQSAEELHALAMRREEHVKARTHFRKIVDGGGEVDDWIRKFMDADEEDDEGGDASLEY